MQGQTPAAIHKEKRPGIGSALMNRTKSQLITDTILAAQKNSVPFVLAHINL